MNKLLSSTLFMASYLLSSSSSSFAMATEELVYHKCGVASKEIHSIKEVRYNKVTKRLDIIKAEKIAARTVSNLAGLRSIDYHLSGDLQGYLPAASNKNLGVYKLTLDEGVNNDKVRRVYGEELQV